MPETATTYQYLKPKSGYEQLFVLGRIPTWTIHSSYTEPPPDGRSVEELAADWNIPVEAVREAIAYCASKPPEMATDWRREEALMEASGMNDPNYKWNPHPRPISPQEIARINQL